MADKCSQDAANDGGATELLGRVEANKDVDAPESCITNYYEKLKEVICFKHGIIVAGNVQGAGNEAAGNEGGHQRQEDGGKFQQELPDRWERSRIGDRIQAGLAGGQRLAREVS